ncbi:MAG: dihydroorotate dehydrogenase electron transfer subunit [Candidatus Omnitrophica bacterium]|nr:dihydroorotate dehydrogenase electron transfer subunit [Candidatus Omnitrophota bacterium]
MPQIDAKIISNNKISKIYYLLRMEVASGFKHALPGQFVHIKINDVSEPLLRRPFSIHRILPVRSKSNSQKVYLDVLYEIKGKGTQLLTRKNAGECLNVLGPLGRGFDYQIQKGDKLNILIAGGMGVAPLNFLAEKLGKSKKLVLIGSATESRILCEEELKKSGCEVKIATEDGSRGFKGKVTDLFEKKTLPQLNHPAEICVYACGPKAMLIALSKICLIKKIPLQVSLEEFMGCGIGACLGCAIETKYGFRRVCSDGPVFNAEDIAWKF